MSRDNLRPLAKVKRGVTLSCSPSGDQHFLVKKGSTKKISLEVACKLYRAAKEKGDLLWNRSTAAKKSKQVKHPESSAAWREELREKLGYDPDPK